MICFDDISVRALRCGKGDCIHLRFIGDSQVPRNVIIDTGPTSAAGEFRSLLTGILTAGESLDALFITHYDDDHIGGILKVGDPGFRDIYFNASTGGEETENLSAAQNQRLFRMLDSSKVHPCVLSGTIWNLDGAEIRILGPTQENLVGAKKRMENVPLASASDWCFSLDELMRRGYPAGDASIANRASIVLSFAYRGRRFLFCGDAPANCIMGDLGHFDLVKLPHHGSIRNLSEDLLDRLDADVFLICADGTSHPNKQTVAKLLAHYGTVTICSNYAWWLNGFLMQEDTKYWEKGKLTFPKI